jgi:hypothetical protein
MYRAYRMKTYGDGRSLTELIISYFLPVKALTAAVRSGCLTQPLLVQESCRCYLSSPYRMSKPSKITSAERGLKETNPTKD